MPTSDKVYEAYVIADKRVRAAYDALVSRGLAWYEIADDVTYCEVVAEKKKAHDAWKKTWRKYAQSDYSYH